MSADLPRLAAAPRSDVLAGWLLSPLQLRHFAQAEQEFAARHLLAAGRAAEQLSDRTAKLLLESAQAEVANGRFNYGGRGFDACCLAVTSLPFLLWLALQPKHPQVTRDQAAALLTPENESAAAAVRRAVLELAGFDPRPHKSQPQQQAVPIDWRRIYKHLADKGYSPAEVSTWSIPQLMNVLGSDDDELPFEPPEEAAAKRRAAADRIFDDIRRRRQIAAPAALASMDAESLAAAVREINPAAVIDARMLLAARDDYVKRKSEESR